MDTKAIEKFSVEARRQLLNDVEQRLYTYGLDDAGRAEFGPEADVVRGMVLGAAEKGQRLELYRRIEEEGSLPFVEEMAYTWFNRLAAIRYMELHDFLSNHVRMLSAADGSFDPECIRAASTLDLPGLERDEVARLIQSGDDEALYRAIIVAQCNELAASLPAVFGTVAADALTLPGNLLRRSEGNVLFRLVTDIPEQSWKKVEILGWMYQFYNSEVKAEFFKSKRKATEADLAPATQLFTPEWIVRYMVDNSLGRLWMLNHPESRLRECARLENPNDRLMEYYIEPDEKHEDFLRVASPEELTFCDPACGSGHILAYAFRMLMAIYEECGYRRREIPELILTKNLSGLEIDPRAAQIATMTLTFCAREHDRRFFDRGVVADVRVLQDVRVDRDALSPKGRLREKKDLLESLRHLGEVGSLLQPTSDDIAALEAELASGAGSLFASQTRAEIQRAADSCRALARRFDVVVANPPYMGSGNFNSFMSKWAKKRYPDSCKDLCTAFIERSYNLVRERGYSAMVTMQSWMFLGSFEKMRNKIIDEKTIVTMAHLGPRAFDAIGGEVVSVTADVLFIGRAEMYGSYVRLVDIAGEEPKRKKLLEAIQNPNCGWFYRADASTFHDIPGSPIAYWASNAVNQAFTTLSCLASAGRTSKGIITGDNRRFLRLWWEVSQRFSAYVSCDVKDTFSDKKWFACSKGGQFRKWSGNIEYLINWQQNGKTIFQESSKGNYHSQDYADELKFVKSITWSSVSSGAPSFRLTNGVLSEHAGMTLFLNERNRTELYLAFCNSSVAALFLQLLSPTLNINAGEIDRLPVAFDNADEQIISLAKQSVFLSKTDWDSQETSWDFTRNPLV